MLALGVLAAATLGGYTVDTCPPDSYCIHAAVEIMKDPVSRLAVQPNGQYMAGTNGYEMFVRLTNEQSTYGDQPDAMFVNDGAFIVFTPDNQQMFVGTPSGVYAWRTVPSSEYVVVTSSPYQTLAVSADSTLLATGPTVASPGNDLEGVKIYNTDTLAEVASVLVSEGGVITELTFSPDGAYLAYCNAGEGVVVVIRTADWTRAFEYQLMGVNTVRFSADSSAVLAASVTSRQVVRWSLESNAEGHQLVRFTEVTSFAWSPDARRIAHGSGTTVTVHQLDSNSKDHIKITADHAVGVMMFRRDTVLQTCAKESGHCKIWSIPAATTLPTAIPTLQPIGIPTPQPTDIPSVQPTELPSVQPTNIPSVPTTVEPSAETTNAPPSVLNKIKQKACVSFIEQILFSAPYPKHKHHCESEKKYFPFSFFFHTRLFLCFVHFLLKKLCFECETFLHVLHGKQHDKQVQGGSVLTIEPGTLCVSQKPKKRCV